MNSLRNRIESFAPGWWPIIKRCIRRKEEQTVVSSAIWDALWVFPYDNFRGLHHLSFADWILEERIPGRIRKTTAFWED
jgi:hypothetical protein